MNGLNGKRTSGFTLIELMIVIAVIAIIAAISIPSLLNSQRAAAERSGSASLKTLATAEHDFKSNDRDYNQLRDFWTADVSGLYRILGPGGDQLQLIDASVARGDGMPSPPGDGGGRVGPMLAPTAAKANYWYMAMENNLNGIPPGPYKIDYGDGMGPVHNRSHFGFISYPGDYPGEGQHIFMINEENTMFKRNPGAQVAGGGNPRPAAPIWLDYPADPLLAGWGPMD